jgi:hypothetical protein
MKLSLFTKTILALSLFVGTGVATFAQDHHCGAYPALKYCVHGKCYLAANRPGIAMHFNVIAL